MKTEEEVVADIRDDIIRARNLLTDALECTSKPVIDYKRCWGKLNVACHYVSNAESAVYNNGIVGMC